MAKNQNKKAQARSKKQPAGTNQKVSGTSRKTSNTAKKTAPKVRNRASNVKSRRKKTAVEWNFPLNRNNLMIGIVGIAVILIGFLLMATGITEEPAVPDGKWNNPMAVVVAPILLFIGYCVIIPYAIFKYFKKPATETAEPKNN